jgi:hypothetical protein
MTKEKVITGTLIILFFLLTIKLLFHSSQNPFIFNKYSFFYFLHLLLIIPFVIGMIFVLFRLGLAGVQIILKNGAMILGVFILIEVLGQIYAWTNPSYKSLLLYPSEKFGWTYSPGLKFQFTGKHWYAREFSAKNNINSLGFRDVERSFEKDENVFRVALFGASIVAGKESEFENTIGRILERKLNADLAPEIGKKIEVLNFGVDGYGMSQPLVIYHEIARKYDPDVMVLYVSNLVSLWKNYNLSVCWVASYLIGNEDDSELSKSCFLIRPVLWFNYSKSSFSQLIELLYLKEFHDFINKLVELEEYGSEEYFKLVEEYKLLNEKIPDFINLEKLKKVAQLLKFKRLYLIPPSETKRFEISRKKIKDKFFGQGETVKRKRQSFIVSHYETLNKNLDLFQSGFQNIEYEEEFEFLRTRFFTKYDTKPELGNENYLGMEVTVLLALKILQTFDKIAKIEERKFAIIDGSEFHSERNSKLASRILSNILEKFSSIHKFGYIPSGSDLNLVIQKGKKVRWKYDSHLNKLGNETVADGIFKWIEGDMKLKNG